MFKLFASSNIFFWIEKLISFINSIFFVLLLVALSFALIFSPPDYLQGDSVRIMYVHVPSAWIGLASFTSIALLSIANFIFKIKNIKLVTKSIAPIGLMFTCLAIVTGSLWGQPTWGTWWAWDARITSMLIFLMKYNTELIKLKNKGLDRL
jgi:heme exporter protein C